MITKERSDRLCGGGEKESADQARHFGEEGGAKATYRKRPSHGMPGRKEEARDLRLELAANTPEKRLRGDSTLIKRRTTFQSRLKQVRLDYLSAIMKFVRRRRTQKVERERLPPSASMFAFKPHRGEGGYRKSGLDVAPAGNTHKIKHGQQAKKKNLRRHLRTLLKRRNKQKEGRNFWD